MRQRHDRYTRFPVVTDLLVLGIGLLGIAAPLALADEPAAGTFVGTLEGGREVTLRAGKHYSRFHCEMWDEL
jgi:hypothetical protein